MGRKQGSRKGSMAYWPRVTSNDFLPEVNWKPLVSKPSDKVAFLGFIAYKAGMKSAFVKDNTADSMTKNKRKIIPVTLLEVPTVKILSVRFYKFKKIVKDILNDNLDKELGRVLKLPKQPVKTRELLEKVTPEQFDDVRVVIYSQPKKIELKKTPDVAEIGLSGKVSDKIAFIKENLAKEITIQDVFPKGLVDVRGLTMGKGFQGTVKRFGVHYRSHKAEKGQRRVGSIGAWHPVGVMFTVPRPGRMGMHTRVHYNQGIIAIKKDLVGTEMKNYGKISGDCLLLAGSVQGSDKRQVLLTSTLRPTKQQLKRNYELMELR